MTPRGGYREGAGRKALPKSKRGKPAQFYLMPDTIKRIRKGDPPVIAAYRKIMWAARHGKGVRLSPEQVRQMGQHDDAIQQAVWAYDEEAKR